MNPTSADTAAVERVLIEAGVERTVAPPGWSAYLQSLLEALFEALARPFGRAMSGAVQWLSPLAVIVIALIVMFVAWILIRALEQRRRALPRPATDVKRAPASPPVPRDARAWREALERALEAGQVGTALEALWWWIACSLSAGAVERSWTSRELVARAGRAEMAGPARELDRWLYGPRRPEVAEIRRLVAHLEQVLA